MKLNDKRVCFASPRDGALAYSNSFYVRAAGVEKRRTRQIETRNDLLDSDEFAYSSDNGRTWSAWQETPSIFKEPRGTRRRFALPGFVDESRDQLVTIVLEGVLPDDDAMDGLKHYFLRYQISNDGGRSSVTDDLIVQDGYTPEHPFDGVRVGKNAIMIGDLGSRPIRRRDGKILVPAQTTPLGPDGEYANPGGGMSFHESVVLIGTWKDDRKISWTSSQRVRVDPNRSTRGAVEPTIIEAPDGRILMVIRGSNGGSKDRDHRIASYRWFSISHDGGQTWDDVEPWTYDDGEAFFSPSSCSQLIRHSNGEIYWLGNINPKNSTGNSPRYPLVIGRVDARTLRLIRQSLFVVDDRADGEDPSVTLSNFMAHEDRETKELILHMSRFYQATLTGDAYVYRIDVRG